MTPPAIGDPLNVTVHCGEDFSPNSIGGPNVTDNEDLNPSLTYTDSPHPGCTVIRTWNATDAAGNSILARQLIRFSDLQPPIVTSPIQVAVACGSIEDASSNLAHNMVVVHHPCDRPVSSNYSDSANITRCGFSFSRVWQVSDDCGLSAVFTQTIQVLSQQFPDSPVNGHINARLDEPLLWPQFPGATSYQVFVWPEADGDRPALPRAVTTLRYYNTNPEYPPGTRMLWQIEYVIGVNTTIPSPVWGFETEPRPDLQVTDVSVPLFAFSGQTFDVRWSVINAGNLSITVGLFYDSIFMSRTTSFSDSRRVQSLAQRRFLDGNDGYSSEVEVNIAEDDIGSFYIFVLTDSLQFVSIEDSI